MIRDQDRVRVRAEDRANVHEADQFECRRAGIDARQVELPEALNLARDRVRWGPICAGFFTALTAMVLLGLAVGLTAASAGTAAAIWGAVTALVAFLLGGWVAGRTAAVFDRRWGAWNGALVLIVAVPITLWLAGQGLGFLVGTLGDFAGALNVYAGALANQAQQSAGQAQQATRGASEATQAAATARNAAWGP